MDNGNQSSYTVLSIRELAEFVPYGELAEALRVFICSRDPSIERFVRNEAIEFAEELYGTTYVFLDKES